MSENPQASVERVKQEVERWMEAARSAGERTLEAMGLTPALRSQTPAVDVMETADSVQVWIDVPGLAADAVQVATTDSRLTINIIRPMPRETLGTMHLCERPKVSSERTIPLPAAVQPEQTTAQLRDGVLHVTMPKLHAATPRTVPVNVVPR